MEEYIEYEVCKDVSDNIVSLEVDRLPIGTRFFGTVSTSTMSGLEVVHFRGRGNPTHNNYIPTKYIKEATVIRIGGE